jgi:SAM-dependent methyltransferase
MTAQELWNKAILYYWNKWKGEIPSGSYDPSYLFIEFEEEDGFFDKETGEVPILRFMVADPEFWSGEEEYLINKIPDKTKVLELGCGSGRFGVYLKEQKQCNYTGIDTDKSMVDLCKKRGLKAFVMDATDVKFPVNSFDVILIMSNFIGGILPNVGCLPSYLTSLLPFLTTKGIIVTSSYEYTPDYKNYQYIIANGEKFVCKLRWPGTGEESDLTPAFRLHITDTLQKISNTGLYILDQVEILQNSELITWGLVMGKTDEFPKIIGTGYVDWIPVRVTYTEAAVGTNITMNIGDAWKDVSAIKINIGDSWKDVSGVDINIGDVWKEIF